MAVTQEGDATHRVLVGEGTQIQLGTPGLILDVELAGGGSTEHQVPADFQGFAYLLDGAASFGANRARAEAGQLALMGPGESFVVEDAVPGTRYLLMAGKPYGEEPRFNGPYRRLELWISWSTQRCRPTSQRPRWLAKGGRKLYDHE